MLTTNTKKSAVASSDRSKKTFSGNHRSSNCKFTPQQLLELVKTLPPEWALVAVGGNKAPLGQDWTNIPLTQEDFEKAIQAGQFESLFVKSRKGETFHPPVDWWSAIGVLCGTPSGGLLFVDHDGASCDPVIEKLSGQSVTEALPETVAVTSGRLGRYQMIYKVPEQFWDAISTTKFRTEIKGNNGKPEQLEFRWNGCQSVIAGKHPVTGSYHWLPGQAPWECKVAEAPTWIIERMLQDVPPHRSAQVQAKQRLISATWTERDTERDWARSYLAAIPPSEDYDTWLQVGMALHSVGEDLLSDWDTWSSGAANYEPEACEKKWRSFDSGRGVELGTLGMMAKQNGWQSPFKESKGDRPALTVIQASSFKTIPSSLEEADEDFEELAQEVQSFVNLTEERASIQTLLSPHLTTPLLHRAKQFNVPLEAFVGILLPVAASLLKIGTQLEIDAGTDYRCPPILWTGLVGESGANKSPIFESLVKPLEGLQAQADEIYRLELEQYEDALEDWQKRSKEERGNKPTPPVPREYYLQDATLEAIAACLSAQPDRGVVIPIDEFAGFFNSFNQYRSGGKGNDRQKFLSAYDGRAIKVNRKVGNRVSLTRTSISLTGTIQPYVLQKLMSDLHEVDGFWARFFWILLPLTRMPAPGNGGNWDISELLKSLYQGLESLLPTTYRFDQHGRAIWINWHNYCEDNNVNEPNPALRAIYPKSKERAARIALVVHCMNAVIEGRVPDQVIPGNLLEAAIAFTKWSIGQTRLIYAAAGAVSYEETPRIVRFVDKFRDHEWITARNVIHWWSGKPKIKAEAAREFMKQVVDLGHAIDNGATGKAYAIQIKKNDGNSGNNCSQSLAVAGMSSGNNWGNNPVTMDNSAAGTSKKQPFELGSNVTTECISLKCNDSKDSNENLVKLLPDVTSVVTNLNAAPIIESTGICYPVTDTKLQVGDRVVLVGEGNNRPPAELKAIWTIKTIQEQKAAVECETLNCRVVFPLAWLARYERATE